VSGSQQAKVILRPFAPDDAPHVRDLFVAVNEVLAPAHLRDRFQSYIAQSLKEEIERIADYYGERGGGFWVASSDDAILGMFGLEPASPAAMELRRMYVAPYTRRRGIARCMLQFAEEECRHRGISKLVLSTSVLQTAALAFYRDSGFRLEREEVAWAASNKTLGGGIRRFYLSKLL
jgi:ribosomal protein S18 acetylase RimI-like enzyme